MRPGVAHRLPLGAAQAALPEAHLPRPRRRGRWCRSSSSSPSRTQSGEPEDVAFGRYIHDTGLAIPLVLLLFGSVWMFPLITALVAGDIVAAEDHNGTLKTILTRSVERGQVFAGKALADGDLRGRRDRADGDRRGRRGLAWSRASTRSPRCRARRSPPASALGLVGASLLVYLMPILAVACIGLLLSTVTATAPRRSSAR